MLKHSSDNRSFSYKCGFSLTVLQGYERTAMVLFLQRLESSLTQCIPFAESMQKKYQNKIRGLCAGLFVG